MSDRFIPFCIIEDILIRLPCRSVARFKCVCKSWQSFLTTNPSFTTINFKNSMEHSNPNLKVAFCTRDGKFFYFDHKNRKVIPMLLPSKIRYSYKGRYLKILGTCNGFLCISPQLTDEVYVWNPYTCQHKTMSVPLEEEIFGFGYSDTCHDYQFLTVCASGDSSQVCVFSLRSNSCKRLGKIPYVLKTTGGYERGILVNGALHWIALSYTDYDKKVVLLAYDFNTENFSEIPMPNEKIEFISRMTRYGIKMRVCMLHNYLCLSFKESRREEQGPWEITEIWVMASYGEKESWTMYHNVKSRQTIYGNIIPLCLVNNGKEIVLVGEQNSCGLDFYFYERDNQRFKKFERKDILMNRFDVITYVDTNVSLRS